MKFFLVEDSESIRALIRSLIEDYHFTVVGEAAKEIEAIQGVIETQPDVMIVDLNLEAGSGVEVIRQIKKHNPALMIIVFTNQKRSEYEKVCLEAGTDYFLEKKSQDFKYLESLLDLMSRSSNKTTKN